MDFYFPEALFFVELERFDRHVEKIRKRDQNLDFVSNCIPNLLHDSHIQMSVSSGESAICEKFHVLNQ